jgi:hypothetical protein
MANFLEGAMQRLSQVGEDFSENYASTAGHVEPRNSSNIGTRRADAMAEGDEASWKPGVMDHANRLGTTYRDTMLGSGQSTMRRAIGYGVPGVAAVGLGVGAYDQGRDGNGGGAAVLGAGAAVIGGALALSHFGAVAAGGIEREVAQKMSNVGSVGVAAETMGTAGSDVSAATSMISNAKTGFENFSATVKDGFSNAKDTVKDGFSTARDAVKGFAGRVHDQIAPEMVPDDRLTQAAINISAGAAGIQAGAKVFGKRMMQDTKSAMGNGGLLDAISSVGGVNTRAAESVTDATVGG